MKFIDHSMKFGTTNGPDSSSSNSSSSSRVVLELEVGQKCFVIKDDEGESDMASMPGWVFAFNVNAMLGYVWRECLEEIF